MSWRTEIWSIYLAISLHVRNALQIQTNEIYFFSFLFFYLKELFSFPTNFLSIQLSIVIASQWLTLHWNLKEAVFKTLWTHNQSFIWRNTFASLFFRIFILLLLFIEQKNCHRIDELLQKNYKKIEKKFIF